MKKLIPFIPAAVILILLVAAAATTMDDFFLPGSQVGQSGNIETPDRCDNCHGGYDAAVEPAFNWRGSMMSQSARDPLFYACLAIANQDAPGVGDMCLRCHTPDGWLNGRCVPTDGSALNNNDRQGVQCDFCHKMVKPTPLGVNPFPGDAGYTSTAYGSGTYTQDQSYLSQIIPIPGTTANGMYIADANNAKRGPFTDATGRHQMFYSPFHSTSDHCGTCHDVSNPVFTRSGTDVTEYSPNSMGSPSETFNLRLMFPVERTYSEWLASGFNAPGTTNHKTCQDCHMKDVTGKGASLKDAKIRTNLPLHDMTGGNTFTPKMVKQKWAAEVNATALDAGIQRDRNTLQGAASMELTVSGGNATVKIINNTGHKLPTGYPEGRRMWINLVAYDLAGNTVFESGAYDAVNAVLNKTGAKIYECEPGNATEASFHFAVNNKIHMDNRIPPAGSTNAKLLANQSPVIGAVYADGQNWDITSYTVPSTAVKVVASLYYQTTSKEYVEFLRDANTTNSAGQELYDLWVANGKSAPELMASSTWNSVAQNVVAATVQSVIRSTNKQGIAYATATVLVTLNGTPKSNATVIATFTGPTNGTVTGTTGLSGIVALKSTSLKTSTGQWCFNISSVILSGGNPAGAITSFTPGCELKSAIIPLGTDLTADLSVYPNPVKEKAHIEYSVAQDGPVRIAIYNNLGQQLTILVNEYLEEGNYSTAWSATGYQEGVYICRMTSGDRTITKTIILKK
jgi:hypothetical protein